MLSATTALTVTLLALLTFAWLGIRGGRRITDRDHYLTARSSLGTGPLALTFFASALGGWILFAPAEVGTFGGLLGIGGYAVGQALAVGVFAVLGPAVRDRLPTGTTILQFVALRFGRTMQAYAGGVSVLYMFIFLTAELTAIGGVLALLAGVDPLWTVVAVAGVTAAYTAYGGLPASLATDRWQAWLVLALVLTGVAAVIGNVSGPGELASAGGIGQISRTGAETFVVLVIAIVAANLFHQGFWQRVWSATDRRSLVRGTLGAGALILPLVFLTGAAGAVAAGRGIGPGEASVAFFTLLEGLPAPALAVIVLLAVTLVASTADTLQNALTSLVSTHVGAGRVRLGTARAVTVALTVPAAFIAARELSVLRIFLVADLFAATIVLPVFGGLWRRATPSGAIAGSAGGLVAIVAYGWIAKGTLLDGLAVLTLPEGPTLWPFVLAPLASGAVGLGVSLLGSAATRSSEGSDQAPERVP